jgi:3-hexulose-6-phosphate synthase
MRLQLALDGTLEDSLRVLRQVRPYIDLAEIGTPLILREGLHALRQIGADFPDLPLVADLKIMDAGALEATLAFEAGAAMVTVMAVTQDVTLAETITAAQHFGCEVMVDLMNVSNPAERLCECMNMGVDYACVHAPHDLRGVSLPDLLQRLYFSLPGAPLAVAGGINLTNFDAIAVWNPVIVIIGSTITRADNPAQVARAFRERIDLYARL